jgi:Asp-tRNA(Asn)/Glu-tRNA(Gln) amidotransferase A subunit family amidase
MQLIGRPFAEGTLLALGHHYEQETGWHTQHPEL